MGSIDRCIDLVKAGWTTGDAVRAALHAAGVYSAAEIRELDPAPGRAEAILRGEKPRPGCGSQLKEAVMAKRKVAGKVAGKAAASKGMSCLDAAVEVLKAEGPLGCADIVSQAVARGLWATGGKTPAATLYSAIIREIARKGEAARFRKEGPGRFAVAS